MNYATIKPFDIANGPGVRVSLFVSGCTHHCKNCFNQETWDFNYGERFTEDTENEILKRLEPEFICGFSLLGGEPFEPSNQKVLSEFLPKIKERYPSKSIWCYSGYLFDRDLLSGRLCEKAITEKMLSSIDYLVDGPFVEEKKNIKLRFKGSWNQRIIDVQASLKAGEIILWECDNNDV